MFSGSALQRHYTDSERPRWQMHNPDDLPPLNFGGSDSALAGSSPAVYDNRGSGMWGERDVGGPVNQRMAMEDYETLRKELTSLSKTRSNRSRSRSRGNNLSRTTTRGSQSEAHRTQTQHNSLAYTETNATDVDRADGAEEDDFELDQFMREGHFEKRKDGVSAKKVGVIFRNLTVKGVGSTATFVKTLPDAVIGTFGPDLYKLVTRFLPFLAPKGHRQMRTLLHDFTGVIRDGEMMLVLGRPGSGCSTFLKAIANNREEYAEVTGDVSYGGIDAAKQKKQYRGEVNYNPEDDVHFPELNVWQTFMFALLTKTKKREKKDIPTVIDALMRMFGIPHTKYTKVGNEYVRGISGGERKRVSIAETLATKSTVLCWDNSTRGLDASTALDYARSLRIMTDVSNRTTLVTLYQAGEGIYEVMDKVMVIDAGRCIYQGPAKEARQYFIDLGFHAPERQTTADFLTACTDATERRFQEGREDSAPKTAEELERVFRESSNYKRVVQDVEDYERFVEETDHADAKEFEQTVQESKSHKTVAKTSPYTVSFWQQVLTCARREMWLLWGDKTTLYTKVFIIISNGLIVGSLFYGQSLDTEGAFTRGGSLFFSILFIGWLQLSELMKAVTGRAVVQRQKDYAFYRPSAVSLARVLVDLPVIFPQVALFGILMYFLTGLSVDVSKFFIYLLFVYITAILLTALYRMFAALSPAIDDAVRFSGISLNLLIIYTGYVIPKPQLLQQYIWFGWIYYINPIAYSFEAVLANEFAFRTMDCAEAQTVPTGPSAVVGHQGCNIAGSSTNSLTVTGARYIETSFNYTRSHLWRNFGVVIAFIALYILITVWATETFNFAKGGGGALVYKKTRRAKQQTKQAAVADEEKAGEAEDSSASSTPSQSGGNAEKEALKSITGSESVFTWEDVDFSVPYQGGQKQLLNHVSGYAKPGVMIALMGASGAGKSTLLNTLSQRNGGMGIVGGDMLVDGHPLGIEFQRGTGFCEQMDLHDGTATIREALDFSAILRQDNSVSRAEKLEYVDKIVDLLELNEMQDTIVSCLGVEQRKRLTIGVELAAKPSLLLFLDEPTSGLDSQSAFSIIRFLRKLAAAGQAIVCTIHQPSSVLIQEFDMILALNPGGNTFYFGPVGDEGSAVVKYFSERGFDCPPSKNIAEFLLEIAAKPRRRPDGTKVDWNEEWRGSKNAQELKDEIQRVKTERGKLPRPKLEGQRQFAAPVMLQTIELTKRTFKQHWRDPSYLYGKLFVAVIVGIFNGFTFWQLGNSVQDMQNRMFSAFLIVTIPPTVVNAVVPKFFQNMMLWQARELPSRIYGWVAFTTAQVVCEIPISVVQSVLYFVLWYFPAGLPYESSTSGYVFLMTLLFFFFMSSWGQWITAFAPSFTVISNVLPFFFVMFSLFNGVVRPYSMLPVFWRYWMYYVNPSTWWIGGVLAATLSGIPVQCTADETAAFTPPPGQTCASYTSAYAAVSPGYLLPATGDGVCRWCEYSVGDNYLSSLNISASDKWQDFGIFLAFVISNWALVYFFVWSVRIKGWSFGFGYIFGGLGKMVDSIKGLFSKSKREGNDEESADGGVEGAKGADTNGEATAVPSSDSETGVAKEAEEGSQSPREAYETPSTSPTPPKGEREEYTDQPGTAGMEQPREKADASEMKALEASDKTADEGAHTFGGV